MEGTTNPDRGTMTPETKDREDIARIVMNPDRGKLRSRLGMYESELASRSGMYELAYSRNFCRTFFVGLEGPFTCMP